MLNEIEKDIIRLLQEDLPLCSRPFAQLATEVGVTEDELLAKISQWQENGTIRRFGAAIYHRNVGVTANAMVVWRVPEEDVPRFSEYVTSLDQVSHCYQRRTYSNWPYNLYTMIHGGSREACNYLAQQVSEKFDLGDYQVLYSSKELKKVSMKYFAGEKGDREE